MINKFKIHFLYVIFSISIVLSNIFAMRTINTGIYVCGVEITLPGGILLYAITYLCTDILGENYGKKEANKCVIIGLLGQVYVSLISIILISLPCNDQKIFEMYNIIFSTNIFFTFGMIIAYLVSQTWDVYIFHLLKNRIAGNEKGHSKRWIWNNVGTISSQLIDTIIFSIISFGIGLNWLFMPNMRMQLLLLGVGQFLAKVIIALLDTPIFYLFTRKE